MKGDLWIKIQPERFCTDGAIEDLHNYIDGKHAGEFQKKQKEEKHYGSVYNL